MRGCVAFRSVIYRDLSSAQRSLHAEGLAGRHRGVRIGRMKRSIFPPFLETRDSFRYGIGRKRNGMIRISRLSVYPRRCETLANRVSDPVHGYRVLGINWRIKIE